MSFVAWLSITFDLGLYPFCVNWSKFSLYALKMLKSSSPGDGCPLLEEEVPTELKVLLDLE
jgi:hypothetical protein